MSYPNEVFSLIAFLGFILALIPLWWHLNACNVGTCLYMVWTSLSCLNLFVNSVVWNGNVDNWAPVWCDISTQIIIASSMGIPACSLCINRRLYYIACLESAVTGAQKRREIKIDFAVGLGLPALQMILGYISQSHRFDIFEDVGCYPGTGNTPVAVALVYVPPVAVGCVTACYSVLTIRAFYMRNKRLRNILSTLGNSSGSDFTIARYSRLMWLTGIEVVCTVPLSSYWIYLRCVGGVEPWVSFTASHSGFSRVGQHPASEWRSQSEAKLEISRLQVEMCSFVFFAFFGFTEEARRRYGRAWRMLWGAVRRVFCYPYQADRGLREGFQLHTPRQYGIDFHSPPSPSVSRTTSLTTSTLPESATVGFSCMEQRHPPPIYIANTLPSNKLVRYVPISRTSLYQIPPIPSITPFVYSDISSRVVPTDSPSGNTSLASPTTSRSLLVTSNSDAIC